MPLLAFRKYSAPYVMFTTPVDFPKCITTSIKTPRTLWLSKRASGGTGDQSRFYDRRMLWLTLSVKSFSGFLARRGNPPQTHTGTGETLGVHPAKQGHRPHDPRARLCAKAPASRTYVRAPCAGNGQVQNSHLPNLFTRHHDSRSYALT